MTIELPKNPDRDDIERYIDRRVEEAFKPLFEQIRALEELVKANEGQADADREEVARIADITDRLDS